MRGVFLVLSGLLSITGVAAMGSARANGPDLPVTTPATVAEHVKRGDKLRKAGQWADAAAEYRAAWETDKQGYALAELGLCELELGRYRDAAEHLDVARFEFFGSLTAQQLDRIRKGHERALREVVALYFAVEPPDAEILGLVAGSVAVVAGVGFLVSAAVVNGELDDAAADVRRRAGRGYSSCHGTAFPGCDDLADTEDRREALEGAAAASFVAGGVIGALTLSSLWWAPSPEPREPRPRVVPVTGAHHAGFVVQGVW